jgi:hypothetical protein
VFKLINEDEELFVRLSLMHEVGSPLTEELIQEGYITVSYGNTKKAEEFMKKFIMTYKEQIFQAMKECDNDNHSAQRKIGLNDWVTFARIADELVYEERFIRDGNGDYKIK